MPSSTNNINSNIKQHFDSNREPSGRSNTAYSIPYNCNGIDVRKTFTFRTFRKSYNNNEWLTVLFVHFRFRATFPRYTINIERTIPKPSSYHAMCSESVSVIIINTYSIRMQSRTVYHNTCISDTRGLHASLSRSPFIWHRPCVNIFFFFSSFVFTFASAAGIVLGWAGAGANARPAKHFDF